MAEKLQTEGHKASVASVPPTPVEATDPLRATDFPARQGTVEQQPPMYIDAPPSYEDAIASDLPPVDAPRPDYAPPPAGEDELLGTDEKKGFGGRRDS